MYLLSIDPGVNSGVALGFYDAITPYQLLERWQVHDGADGFADWLDSPDSALPQAGEIVCEKFILASNDFVADTTPLVCEGVLKGALRWMDGGYGAPIIWQTRQDKASLIGYPLEADTPDKRQRVRFDFLDRFGLFKAGTENDDSNDAITHALISLKRRRHVPTMRAYWPQRIRAAA